MIKVCRLFAKLCFCFRNCAKVIPRVQVWDTTHEARKPTHYIQTINSVARVAWKPGTGFEVASCSLSADFRIYVWHIERPYIPDLCFEKHDNVVSGGVSQIGSR
jgi:WD40 repeat protein